MGDSCMESVPTTDTVRVTFLDELVKLVAEAGEPDDLGLPSLRWWVGRMWARARLINTLLGEERNIVTDIAGTTRDSVHTPFQCLWFRL